MTDKPKAKAKPTITYLSAWDKVMNWWMEHHTIRKGVETAFFMSLSTVITAVIHDLTLLSLENPTAIYISISITALRMMDNFAKHNVAVYGGEKAKKK